MYVARMHASMHVRMYVYIYTYEYNAHTDIHILQIEIFVVYLILHICVCSQRRDCRHKLLTSVHSSGGLAGLRAAGRSLTMRAGNAVASGFWTILAPSVQVASIFEVSGSKNTLSVWLLEPETTRNYKYLALRPSEALVEGLWISSHLASSLGSKTDSKTQLKRCSRVLLSVS